jgi:YgiT-type zinc finger domain-containing protein
MICLLCDVGETRRGTTTLTIERGTMTLVIKAVPAEVCDLCGEATIDEETARCVDRIVDDAEAAGVTFEVREYACAQVGAARRST